MHSKESSSSSSLAPISSSSVSTKETTKKLQKIIEVTDGNIINTDNENIPTINVSLESDNGDNNKNPTKNEKRNIDQENGGNCFSDFSKASDEPVAQLTKYSHTGRLRQQNTFPIKLHSIIERSDIDNYSHIVQWQPHGRSFKIHDTFLLLEHVLKKFFYISKYSSFQRQLNIYGFRKLSKGQETGCYCHELFIRGRSGLCPGILRLKRRPDVHWKTEPNFYEFEPLDDIAAAAAQKHRKYLTAITITIKNDQCTNSNKNNNTGREKPLRNAELANGKVRISKQHDDEKRNKFMLQPHKLQLFSVNNAVKGIDKFSDKNHNQSDCVLHDTQSTTTSVPSLERDEAKACNHNKQLSHSSESVKGSNVATNEISSAHKNVNASGSNCPLRQLSEIIESLT